MEGHFSVMILIIEDESGGSTKALSWNLQPEYRIFYPTEVMIDLQTGVSHSALITSNPNIMHDIVSPLLYASLYAYLVRYSIPCIQTSRGRAASSFASVPVRIDSIQHIIFSLTWMAMVSWQLRNISVQEMFDIDLTTNQ